MHQLFEFTLCLTGIAMICTVFYYFMQKRITHSLALNHGNEVIMVLYFCMAVLIVLLVSLPYGFRILP